MEFKRYKKTVPTKMRILTEDDYLLFQGKIHTREGIQPFQVGDYLAKDAKGQWPIKSVTIQNKYVLVEEENEEGFSSYIRRETVLAAQVKEDFTIEGMTGKAGDYLVLSGDGGWPVDEEIFKQTYRYDL